MKQQSLTEGSIPKGIILFAIPLFLGNLFQQLYNMADSLIVGNFLGNSALAAVTSTGSLIFLLVGFFNGTAMGAGVVISRYFGAKDYEKVHRAVHTDLAFGLFAGVLMTIIGVCFTPAILVWMKTPAEVLPQSILYLRVYFLGSLAVILYNVCMGILQAVGDSRHPLYYLIFSSIVNIIFDLVFCGAFRLGVEYAALATVISQMLSVVLCMIRLIRTQDVYQVSIREIRFDWPLLKQIIHQGLPSGMQNSIISIANMVVQSNINSFGKMAMAGCGAYSKIEGFGFLPITCFAMAMTTFIGQNLGAREFDRVKKGARFGILCGVGLAEAVGIGINLNQKEFEGELSQKATSLFLLTKKEYDKEEVLTVLLSYFTPLYQDYIQGGKKFLTVVKSHSYLDQKKVSIDYYGEHIHGTVIDITDKGTLLLDVSGKQIEVSSGEVTLNQMYLK